MSEVYLCTRSDGATMSLRLFSLVVPLTLGAELGKPAGQVIQPSMPITLCF
jgi:hypothetical protein